MATASVKDTLGTPTNSKQDEACDTRDSCMLATDDFGETPREYQLELLERALARNTLVYLETGAGKTLIACLLIRNRHAQPGKRHTFFLVPKVPLVAQQAAYVERHTALKVGKYWGDCGVDMWDLQRWKKEFAENEVLVMTHQILLNILDHGFFHLSRAGLIIIDECHHARGNHPYALIMSKHYARLLQAQTAASEGNSGSSSAGELPIIFGMTASPYFGKSKGGTREVVNEKIQELEARLHATLLTPSDRAAVEAHTPTPSEIVHYYDAPADSILKPAFQLFGLSEDICTANGELDKLVRRQILSAHAFLVQVGRLAAANYLQDALKHKHKHTSGTTVSTCNVDIEEQMDVDDKEGSKAKMLNDGDAVMRACSLVHLLHEYACQPDLRAIVFVERRDVAAALLNTLTRLPSFTFEDDGGSDCGTKRLRVGLITGHSRSATGYCGADTKKQRALLEKFRDGRLNVLIATSVAEEGIDIQRCRCVVRFNSPATAATNIQSRGRARQQGSDYVHMVERGDVAHEAILRSLHETEGHMLAMALARTDPANVPVDPGTPQLYMGKEYKVESTGAIITFDSSISLLHNYCVTLPQDEYCINTRPVFKEIGWLHGCVSHMYCTEVHLPANCPLPSKCIRGEPQLNTKKAKQSAALEACIVLHKHGAINNHLLPDVRELPEGIRASPRKRKYAAITAVLPTIPSAFIAPRAISACSTVTMYAHRIYPLSLSGDSTISSFTCGDVAPLALLAWGPTPDDLPEVALQFSHNLHGGLRFSPARMLTLTMEQYHAARTFQSVVFAAITRSHARNQAAAEDESRSYLVLPVADSSSSNVNSDVVDINWQLVEQVNVDTAEAVNSDGWLHPSVGDYACFANRVVTGMSQGHEHFVLQVRNDMSPASTFLSGRQQNERSFADYHTEKYRVAVDMSQPMLEVRNISASCPLLLAKATKDRVKRKAAGTAANSIANSDVDGHQDNQAAAKSPPVFLVPQTCWMHPIPASLWRAVSWLPAAIWRLETFLCAHELREKVAWRSCIPLERVVEALTAASVGVPTTLERLEVLGDAALKLHVSSGLMLLQPAWHEGQLSAARSNAVCNKTLSALATETGLSGLTAAKAFDMRTWCAPGLGSSQLDDSSTGQTIPGKTLADAVEALIGAYLVEGGPSAARYFMRWVGISVLDEDKESELLSELLAKYPPKVSQSTCFMRLERAIGYTFKHGSLLEEAFTHATWSKARSCYQRLEFLGDAVLDCCVMRWAFSAYGHFDPGMLSILRAQLTNNECFARIALAPGGDSSAGLQKFLLHASPTLTAAINEFAAVVERREASEAEKATAQTTNKLSQFRKFFAGFGTDDVRAPKVLGDILESLAGAVYLDTGMDIDRTWQVLEPLIRPAEVPVTGNLHPVTELHELCQMIARAKNPEKKMAKKMAAIAALDVIGRDTATLLSMLQPAGEQITNGDSVEVETKLAAALVVD
eukprot:jgi/Chlat1/2248/Chrsp17S02786